MNKSTLPYNPHKSFILAKGSKLSKVVKLKLKKQNKKKKKTKTKEWKFNKDLLYLHHVFLMLLLTIQQHLHPQHLHS